MKTMTKLTKLAAVVSLLAASQAASALTIWGNGAPYITIYTSGGSAQDKALNNAVSALAVSGTVDTFQDVFTANIRQSSTLINNFPTYGGSFTAWYFTGANNLTDVSLHGKNILLIKRTLGSAGYGVIPLLDNTPLDNLSVSGLSTQANWLSPAASSAAYGVTTKAYTAPIVTTLNGGVTTNTTTVPANAASTYLTQIASQGGFTGVDAPSLLQPGWNYPAAIKEISTNAPVATFTTSYTPAALTQKNITRFPTGGEIYGIAVTTDLYKVLQAAQIADGSLTLPSGHSIGSYTADGDLPTLSSNFIAALLAGNIPDWSKVLVNTTANGVQALTSTTLTTAAGVTAPGNTAVAVAIRNAGAAVGAVGYAKFLGYPYVAGSSAPAQVTPDTATDEENALPLIKAPTNATDTDNLLNDWQYGDNASGHNNVPGSFFSDAQPTYQKSHIWGVALQTGDRNQTSAYGYRYVKVDGAAPTIANVANGTYKFWAEGEVLVNPAVLNPTPFNTASAQLFLKDFGLQLGSIAIANAVDNSGSSSLVQPYGPAGIFATPLSAPAGAVSVPYVLSNPFVPFSHAVAGNTTLGITPYFVDTSAASTSPANASIQLK